MVPSTYGGTMQSVTRQLVVIALIILPTIGQKVRFDGYKVFEVIPHTVGHIQFLGDLKHDNYDIDFWLTPSQSGHPVHVLVPPNKIEQLTAQFDDQSLEYKIHIDDVQAHFDNEEKAMTVKRNLEGWDYTNFNTLDHYYAELNALTYKCPKGFACKIGNTGKSYEGRSIPLFSIQKEDGNNCKGIMVDSLIHAREWLSGATVMNIINRLLSGYGKDGEATELLNNHDFYFIPIVNPDGFRYTYTKNRNWRKSRNPTPKAKCYGTDLNRNFPYKWNMGGSSDDPCSITYHGSSAGSEPEVRALIRTANKLSNKLLAWISIHTYGQYWLDPFGDCTNPKNEKDLTRVLEAGCGALQSTYKTIWHCGNSCKELYATSGTTSDWLLAKADIKYSYTIELRGGSFSPPPSEIEPSTNEVWNGIAAAAREMRNIEHC